MDKAMKVWECGECETPCVLAADKTLLFTLCPWSSNRCNWHETTRYEITEHKPDYAGMAEKRQIGLSKGGLLCKLVKYVPESPFPFHVILFGSSVTKEYESFTPCAEPVEIDPFEWRPES